MNSDLIPDTERLVRQGFPEIVFAGGKTPVQTALALQALVDAHGHAMATRVDPAMAEVLSARFIDGVYDATARIFRIGQMPARPTPRPVSVICAGSSDAPVGEEAAQTLEFMGFAVRRIYDVGIAGLHRLLARLELISDSSVAIVVAGMEGALPGVVAGLVGQPVIAVPTSVGYGTSYQGLSALLSMLNSCASGMTVVNIDNGFGAALAAVRILNGNSTAVSQPS